MQPTTATKANGLAFEPPPQQTSLLDQIVAEQAQVASRYMPVMDAKTAITRMKAIKELKECVLVEGEDYGKIPGTDKPTLLKPGAEKICAFFAYVPRFEILAGSIEDWTGAKFGEPLFYYHVCCTLEKDRTPVGSGTGSCSNWESKYRYRWVPENMLPPGVDKNASLSRGGMRVCTEFDFAIEKAETGGKYGKPAEYWAAFRTAIDNGTAKRGEKEMKGGRKGATWSIEIGETVFRVSNPEFADTINTVQKMADKRAYIAATLSATGASQWFTQDLEDMHRESEDIAAQHGQQANTKEAAQAVANKKIADGKAAAETDPDEWRRNFQSIMNQALELLGEERFMDVLQAASEAASVQAKRKVEIRSLNDITDKKLANFVWAKHMSPAVDAEIAKRGNAAQATNPDASDEPDDDGKDPREEFDPQGMQA